MIVAAVELATDEVVILNDAVVLPELTVTLEGTTALDELDDRLTTTPAAGAAAPKVTVPVEGVPPTTDVGDTETDCNPEEL